MNVKKLKGTFDIALTGVLGRADSETSRVRGQLQRKVNNRARKEVTRTEQ